MGAEVCSYGGGISVCAEYELLERGGKVGALDCLPFAPVAMIAELHKLRSIRCISISAAVNGDRALSKETTCLRIGEGQRTMFERDVSCTGQWQGFSAKPCDGLCCAYGSVSFSTSLSPVLYNVHIEDQPATALPFEQSQACQSVMSTRLRRGCQHCER